MTRAGGLDTKTSCAQQAPVCGLQQVKWRARLTSGTPGEIGIGGQLLEKWAQAHLPRAVYLVPRRARAGWAVSKTEGGRAQHRWLRLALIGRRGVLGVSLLAGTGPRIPAGGCLEVQSEPGAQQTGFLRATYRLTGRAQSHNASSGWGTLIGTAPGCGTHSTTPPKTFFR